MSGGANQVSARGDTVPNNCINGDALPAGGHAMSGGGYDLS